MHSKDFSLLSFVSIASYHMNHHTTSTSHCPHDLIRSKVIATLNIIYIHNLSSSSQWPSCRGPTNSYCRQPKKRPSLGQMLPVAWRTCVLSGNAAAALSQWVPQDCSKAQVPSMAFGAELTERSLLICPHDTNTKLTGRQADGRPSDASQAEMATNRACPNTKHLKEYFEILKTDFVAGYSTSALNSFLINLWACWLLLYPLGRGRSKSSLGHDLQLHTREKGRVQPVGFHISAKASLSERPAGTFSMPSAGLEGQP